MDDFDQTPFADPFFAAIAERHGHKPENMAWDKYGGTDPFAEIQPSGMPRYMYNKARWAMDANLCIYTSEGDVSFNYARGKDGANLILFRITITDAMKVALKGRALSQLIDCTGAEGYVITGFRPMPHNPDAVVVLIEHARTRAPKPANDLSDLGPPQMMRSLPVAGMKPHQLDGIARSRSSAMQTFVLALCLEASPDDLAKAGWLTNTTPGDGFDNAVEHGMVLIESPKMHWWMLKMIVDGVASDASRLQASAVLYEDGRRAFEIASELFEKPV